MLKIITLALLVVVSTPLSFAQGTKPRGECYEKGRAAAAEDIKKGIYVVQTAGMLMPNNYPWPTRGEIYESILKEKYKVSLVAVAGCTMETEEGEYMDGYNEGARAAVEAEYGKGIWGEQAEAEYEAKYGPKEKEHDKQYREARGAWGKALSLSVDAESKARLKRKLSAACGARGC